MRSFFLRYRDPFWAECLPQMGRHPPIGVLPLPQRSAVEPSQYVRAMTSTNVHLTCLMLHVLRSKASGAFDQTRAGFGAEARSVTLSPATDHIGPHCEQPGAAIRWNPTFFKLSSSHRRFRLACLRAISS